jgi:hypothetical protein
VALLAQLRHDLFADQSGAADYHDLHEFPPRVAPGFADAGATMSSKA